MTMEKQREEKGKLIWHQVFAQESIIMIEMLPERLRTAGLLATFQQQLGWGSTIDKLVKILGAKVISFDVEKLRADALPFGCSRATFDGIKR